MKSVPIEEHSSRLQLIHELQERFLRLRVGGGICPDGRSQAVGGVVHELDGFGVGGDLRRENERCLVSNRHSEQQERQDK